MRDTGKAGNTDWWVKCAGTSFLVIGTLLTSEGRTASKLILNEMSGIAIAMNDRATAFSQIYSDPALSMSANSSRVDIVSTAIPGVLQVEPTRAETASSTSGQNRPLTWTQAQTFAGDLTAMAAQNKIKMHSLNSIQFADEFSGSDCGAKINAADAALGSTQGEIWVNQDCGSVWRTAVHLGASGNGHTLRFIQGGLYTIFAPITVSGHNCTVVGPPQSMAVNTITSGFGVQVILQMGNGANLPNIIHITGNYPSLQDIQVDGNFSKNSNGGPNILLSSVSRPEFTRVTSGNSKSHGVELDSVPSAKIFKLMAYQNQQDGLFCNGSSTGGGDAYVTDSEFEANGANGIELSSCPAWRIVHNDIGLNSRNVAGACGLKVYGKRALHSDYENININQFGNNYRDDICIIGSSLTSIGNNISGNIFIGSGYLLTPNTYNNIKLTDGGQNVITDNSFTPSSGTSNACAISLNETAPGRAYPNVTVPNVFTLNNTWGTSAYCDNTSLKGSGFMLPLSGTASGNVLVMSPIAPTISSGFNSGSVGQSAGTSSFTIILGSGPPGSIGVLGLPQANNGWNCSLSNQSRAASIQQTASTNNSATFTNYGTTFAATNWVSGDILIGSCYGR